jgi:hypothetical protein
VRIRMKTISIFQEKLCRNWIRHRMTRNSNGNHRIGPAGTLARGPESAIHASTGSSRRATGGPIISECEVVRELATARRGVGSSRNGGTHTRCPPRGCRWRRRRRWCAAKCNGLPQPPGTAHEHGGSSGLSAERKPGSCASQSAETDRAIRDAAPADGHRRPVWRQL